VLAREGMAAMTGTERTVRAPGGAVVRAPAAAPPSLDTLAHDPRGAALAGSGWDLNPCSKEIWRRLCRRRAWRAVLDVGANYGEMLLDVPLPPGARVWALEPAPGVAACLRRSVARAGVEAEVVELAAGAATGRTMLYEDPRWSGTTTATAAHAAPGAVARWVGCTRLDELLLASDLPVGAPVLVKIDVEGGERDVLAGLLPALPLLGEVLVQAEVAHASDDDLAWMVERWDLHLVDTATWVPVPVASAADARRLLDGGRCYRQDAVLARDVLTGPL
jgi:FkbM family methyltransferase